MRKSQNQFPGRYKKYGTDLRAIFTVLSLIGFLYCFSCTSPYYGGLKRSRDVTQAFETYHVYPQHRYFYLNLENSPYAVMALQNRFTVTSKQWTEFDPQTEKLMKIVDLVKQFPENWHYAYGAYLKDSSGNLIGYWYSSIRLRTLKVDNETQKVSIFTDTPWLRDRERGFGSGMGIRIGR
jgi:hypothetical protein